MRHCFRGCPVCSIYLCPWENSKRIDWPPKLDSTLWSMWRVTVTLSNSHIHVLLFDLFSITPSPFISGFPKVNQCLQDVFAHTCWPHFNLILIFSHLTNKQTSRRTTAKTPHLTSPQGRVIKVGTCRWYAGREKAAEWGKYEGLKRNYKRSNKDGSFSAL